MIRTRAGSRGSPGERIPPLVDARDLEKAGLATDHIKRAVEVVPLILDLPGHNGTLTLAGPQPAQLGMPPKMRLVHHPKLDPAASGQFQRFKFFCQSRAKSLGGRGVLFGVTGARHQQHSSRFF